MAENVTEGRPIITVNLDEHMLKEKLHIIRGQQVMLDFDLAKIYGYTTARFNEQVKNNIVKFDPDFMFQLTKNEFHSLMSKKPTSKRGGTRKMPFAFTEQGIYMLMTVLKGNLAVQQSKTTSLKTGLFFPVMKC